MPWGGICDLLVDLCCALMWSSPELPGHAPSVFSQQSCWVFLHAPAVGKVTWICTCALGSREYRSNCVSVWLYIRARPCSLAPPTVISQHVFHNRPCWDFIEAAGTEASKQTQPRVISLDNISWKNNCTNVRRCRTLHLGRLPHPHHAPQLLSGMVHNSSAGAPTMHHSVDPGHSA